MSDRPMGEIPDAERKLADQVGAKAKRKLEARRESKRGVWFGLGMMGIIGWSVTVPTLLGVALGIWLDGRRSDEISWTLTFLVAGLSLGCANSWYWIAKEDEAMRKQEDEE